MIEDKVFLIDLDGTMYHGNTIIPGAKELIDYLVENQRPFLFLTNNASRTLKQNVEHMEKMGFCGIEEKHFFTSAMAAASYVAKMSEKRRADYIGMDGLREALENKGFVIDTKQADFLFVGLEKEGTYKKYSEKLQHLLHGARLVGTNEDRILATDTGFDVGNGAVVHLFEYASGQETMHIGKPNAPILEEALDYLGIEKQDCAIVGDNLETDILCGIHAGVDTIFVMTGVHHKEDIERLSIYPTLTIENLFPLIKG